MSNIAVELVEQGKAHDYYYTTEWVHRQKETMDRYKRLKSPRYTQSVTL